MRVVLVIIIQLIIFMMLLMLIVILASGSSADTCFCVEWEVEVKEGCGVALCFRNKWNYILNLQRLSIWTDFCVDLERFSTIPRNTRTEDL